MFAHLSYGNIRSTHIKHTYKRVGVLLHLSARMKSNQQNEGNYNMSSGVLELPGLEVDMVLCALFVLRCCSSCLIILHILLQLMRPFFAICAG